MRRKLSIITIMLVALFLVFMMVPGGLILGATNNGSNNVLESSITIHKTASYFNSGTFTFQAYRASGGGTQVFKDYDGDTTKYVLQATETLNVSNMTPDATGKLIGTVVFENITKDGYRIKESGMNGAEGVATSLTSPPTAIKGTINNVSGFFRIDKDNPPHKTVYFDNFKTYGTIYIEKTTIGDFDGDFIFQVLRADRNGNITIGSTNYFLERTVSISAPGGSILVKYLKPDGYIVREIENLGADKVDWSFGVPELEDFINHTTDQFRLDKGETHEDVYFLNFKETPEPGPSSTTAVEVGGITEEVEVLEEVQAVRTKPFTVWQVDCNDEGHLEFIFVYPYKDNNWLTIYDMAGNEIHREDISYSNPRTTVALPDGTYTVKTFHSEGHIIQEFTVGLPCGVAVQGVAELPKTGFDYIPYGASVLLAGFGTMIFVLRKKLFK